MSRPRIPRRVRFRPRVTYFKPRGVPLRSIEEVQLRADELEALKLYHVDNLDQTASALEMGISQPTFARLINQATKKLVSAILRGRAVSFES